MLLSLSIRNVVLIERLDLSFDNGLCVLTGETGAGKSILLDALGLALGARADSTLVRHGANQANISAILALPSGHPCLDIMDEQGLEHDGNEVILRRVLSADGRSRAFVNDQPTSVGLLRQFGEALVEIHGQFETHGLLNPKTHLLLLDNFGGLQQQRSEVRAAHEDWRALEAERIRTEHAVEKAKEDEDYLRHAVDEIDALDPKPGEEEELARQRETLQHGEKLADALNLAAQELSGSAPVDSHIRNALSALERVADKAGGKLDPVIGALDRALLELSDGLTELDSASAELVMDPQALERIEERLFALKALARKHNTTVENLPAVRETLEKQLSGVENSEETLKSLRKQEAGARAAYEDRARALSQARREAAGRLDQAVNTELPPLKLESAVFTTQLEALDEKNWSQDGMDKVGFVVATNPGTPAGPIQKVASGGELARIMLALKVVLAAADPVPTIVFDEVDSGVGGATASAVGERLKRLAGNIQVLVVTHSPQVASQANQHMVVAKSSAEDRNITQVHELAESERKEEIARMLAGTEVTEEARAAAGSLLEGGGMPTGAGK